MSAALAVDEFLPYDEVVLTRSDRLAIAAAYNQLFAHGAANADAAVRDQVTELTPGRACVAGLVALGGLTSFLAHNDPDGPISAQIAAIVAAAANAAQYRELR